MDGWFCFCIMIPLTAASLQFLHSETETSSAANISIFVVLKLQIFKWKTVQRSVSVTIIIKIYYTAAAKRSHPRKWTYTFTHLREKHTSSNQSQLQTTTYIQIYRKYLSHTTLIVLMYSSDHISRARVWLANHYVPLSLSELPKRDILVLLWLCKVETMPRVLSGHDENIQQWSHHPTQMSGQFWNLFWNKSLPLSK